MTKKGAPIPEDLKLLANQFASWREKKRYQSEKTPPELWESAIKLARLYKINKVASYVGLDGTCLRAQIEKSSSKSQKAAAHHYGQKPTLVKLAPIVLPMPKESRTNDATIEIEGSNNLRLRVTGADAEAVVRLFMEVCR